MIINEDVNLTDKTTVSLGSALDIVHVSALKERLSAALEKKPHIVLIANKVERSDTAGLQLIYAFKKEVEQRGKQLSWQKPSEKLILASNTLGMTEVLNII